MSNAEKGAQALGRAKLRNSTTVFLVGNIEPTMEWYTQLGFASEYYPPGFAILRRDEVEIFLQQESGYVVPDDLKISRQLCPQDYGMMEFDVMDLNGHRLVFAQAIPK